jgi:FAD dependent oxidoreductase
VELSCDVLIVGAGCGGVAGAIAAARLGRTVVLTEPTSWVGGQLTTQAVPPDEHPWVEDTGITRSYRLMRQAVRDRYRAEPQLTQRARRDPWLNPGNAWVSRLSADPAIIHEVLRELLRPWVVTQQLRVLTNHRPIAADVSADRIRAVEFKNLSTSEAAVVNSRYVLDASEQGELLPLTGCEHVVGAESAADTGELHALAGPADPDDQQAITWCAALELCPGEDHTIDKPGAYSFWRNYRAPHWPGPQLGWTTLQPETGEPMPRPLFHASDRQDLWTFRRIRFGLHYEPPRSDITIVNWPQVDYWVVPVIGASDEERTAALTGAQELTLSFMYWLQTAAERPDGGAGYPELRPYQELFGSVDGLAAQPYVRESRRVCAVTTVLEQHVGVAARPGATTAEPFHDTAGVGSYRIDLHPSTSGRGYLDIATYPFQIPLGALIPRRIENLLAAGKCLGVTHITNGCYRLHPVEWNVGESAGALASFSLERSIPPVGVRNRAQLLEQFQAVLARLGVQLHWPEAIRRQAPMSIVHELRTAPGDVTDTR